MHAIQTSGNCATLATAIEEWYTSEYGSAQELHEASESPELLNPRRGESGCLPPPAKQLYDLYAIPRNALHERGGASVAQLHDDEADLLDAALDAALASYDVQAGQESKLNVTLFGSIIFENKLEKGVFINWTLCSSSSSRFFNRSNRRRMSSRSFS